MNPKIKRIMEEYVSSGTTYTFAIYQPGKHSETYHKLNIQEAENPEAVLEIGLEIYKVNKESLEYLIIFLDTILYGLGDGLDDI